MRSSLDLAGECHLVDLLCVGSLSPCVFGRSGQEGLPLLIGLIVYVLRSEGPASGAMRK